DESFGNFAKTIALAVKNSKDLNAAQKFYLTESDILVKTYREALAVTEEYRKAQERLNMVVSNIEDFTIGAIDAFRALNRELDNMLGTEAVNSQLQSSLIDAVGGNQRLTDSEPFANRIALEIRNVFANGVQ